MKRILIFALLLAATACITPTRPTAVPTSADVRSYYLHRIVQLENPKYVADQSGMCWPIPQPLICQKDPLPPL